MIGDGAASMKFFVGMGVTFYAGKTQLGYIKNVCSVVSAGKYFYDISTGKSSASTSDTFIWDVTARGASLWLNGTGALVEWVGKDVFVEAGKTQIPEAAWPIMGIVASVATAIKDCQKG